MLKNSRSKNGVQPFKKKFLKHFETYYFENELNKFFENLFQLCEKNVHKDIIQYYVEIFPGLEYKKIGIDELKKKLEETLEKQFDNNRNEPESSSQFININLSLIARILQFGTFYRNFNLGFINTKFETSKYFNEFIKIGIFDYIKKIKEFKLKINELENKIDNLNDINKTNVVNLAKSFSEDIENLVNGKLKFSDEQIANLKKKYDIITQNDT